MHLALSPVRAAAKALGDCTSKELNVVKSASYPLLLEQGLAELRRSGGRDSGRKRRRSRDNSTPWTEHPRADWSSKLRAVPVLTSYGSSIESISTVVT